MLWSNNDVLRQAGLVDEKNNPRPPRDWDELRDYANKLTIYRVPGDKGSGIVRLGFAPNSGNSWLYMYAWQAGGDIATHGGDVVDVELGRTPHGHRLGLAHRRDHFGVDRSPCSAGRCTGGVGRG